MLRPNDIIGPYKLTRKLGSGAFGEVWLAEKHAAIVSPEVAIKFALSDDIDFEAVKREAEVWKLASGHPNVIPIIEANVYDGHLVIVSEYARDGSLNNWLKRHNGRAPSISVTIEMMMGILAGLERLHTQRVVHRDLKPDNILLQGATPRLADFGISRVITSKYSEHAVGTLPYQAPETFKGRYIEQTDLWSAGVILYQLLVGRRPFPQTDPAALISAILHEPHQPLSPEAPSPLQDVITRALQKDPAQRYRSAAEMREALREASQPDLARKTIEINPPSAEPTIIDPPPTPSGPSHTASSNQSAESSSVERPRHQPEAPAASPIEADLPNQPIKPPVTGQPRRNRRKYAAAGVVLLALAIGLVMFLNRNSSAPANAGTVADSSTLSALQPASFQSFTEDLGNGVKLEMMAIQGGSFTMGSEAHAHIEQPHRVTVPSFYLGKYEVTQAQWKAVIGNNPSIFTDSDKLPVDSVSWNKAKEFCRKLSQMTGKDYRLPTEAEWEYACRAGTTGDYAGDPNVMAWSLDNSGQSIVDAEKFSRIMGFDYRNFRESNKNRSHPVGQKRPNAFGLYDMHGNVWEWCEDVWHSNYDGAPANGSAWLSGDKGSRIKRGGGWADPFEYCRSTYRSNRHPDNNSYWDGFRIVVSAKTR